MEPRTHSLLLSCDAASAFEVFTSRMGDWWPPSHTPVYAQTWTLAHTADHPSSLTVTFSDRVRGCLVVHGGWHAGNAESRDKFGDWPEILEQYAALGNS